MTEIEQFIVRLPKAELHLHLEGTITPSTLVELSQRHDNPPLTLEEAERFYKFTDFTGFINAFRNVTQRLIDPEDYELAAWRMAQQLDAQGVVHAEVYISVGVIYMWRNHDPHAFDPIFAGLERARERAARELGISIYWIFDAVRHFTIVEAARVFRKAAEMRDEYPSIIGIGLGGDERRCGSKPFRALYAEAKDAGLRLTNHAGETTGPDAIWDALRIGSERIGHALSAIDDGSLMQELRVKQIPLELNPTSNVRTGVCPSFLSHPLRRYFDDGLLVTLNSDDPAFFGANLVDEFVQAYKLQGFTREDLRRLAVNSLEASFLPEEMRRAWLTRVDAAS
ncbi:MAG TPA: adenosine deaminase [Terracidiphilus sp.]|nr:adenosine deaminase [Terracidiphilus sp.]